MVRVGIAIREMAIGDLPAVVTLERATYSSAWSEQVFRDELAQDNRRYVVAEDDDGIAGYAGVMLVADEAHVTTVAVAPDRRGGKVGTRLMLELVSHALAADAAHLTLEVRASNVIAQDLYARFGMASVGLRKNYYQGEDALIMWAHDISGDEYQDRLATIRRSIDA